MDSLKLSAESAHQFGGWRKNDGGSWEWQNVVERTSVLDTIYPNSLKMLNNLRKLNKKDQYEKRWNTLTGASLEIKWTKVFRCVGVVLFECFRLVYLVSYHTVIGGSISIT